MSATAATANSRQGHWPVTEPNIEKNIQILLKFSACTRHRDVTIQALNALEQRNFIDKEFGKIIPAVRFLERAVKSQDFQTFAKASVQKALQTLQAAKEKGEPSLTNTNGGKTIHLDGNVEISIPKQKEASSHQSMRKNGSKKNSRRSFSARRAKSQKKFEDLQDEISKLHTQLREKTDENEGLKQQLLAKTTEITSLKQTADTQLKDLQNQLQHAAGSSPQASSLLEEVKTLLNNQLQAANNEITKLQTELANAKTRLEQFHQIDKLLQSKKTSEQETAQLSSWIEELQNNLTKKQEKYAHLQWQHQQLLQQHQQLDSANMPMPQVPHFYAENGPMMPGTLYYQPPMPMYMGYYRQNDHNAQNGQG